MYAIYSIVVAIIISYVFVTGLNFFIGCCSSLFVAVLP